MKGGGVASLRKLWEVGFGRLAVAWGSRISSTYGHIVESESLKCNRVSVSE